MFLLFVQLWPRGRITRRKNVITQKVTSYLWYSLVCLHCEEFMSDTFSHLKQKDCLLRNQFLKDTFHHPFSEIEYGYRYGILEKVPKSSSIETLTVKKDKNGNLLHLWQILKKYFQNYQIFNTLWYLLLQNVLFVELRKLYQNKY